MIRAVLGLLGLGCFSVVACSSSSSEQTGTTPVDPELIAKYCAADTQLPCHLFPSVEDCKTKLTNTHAYEQHGCVEEQNATLTCMSEKPGTCEQGTLVFAPECIPLLQASESCASGGSVQPDPNAPCNQGGVISPDGGSTCGVACVGFGMTCDGANSCTCTSGPKQGTLFVLGLTDSCDEAAAKTHCL